MIGVLYFASGFAAVVYEVLWLKQLTLLFGNTAQATAMTVAIFFGGLALGSWLWGLRAPRVEHPLRGFAYLELAVAATAASHFALYAGYRSAAPLLHQLAAGSAAADPALRVLLAAILLLPPAILMGGAFPMIGQHVIRGEAGLGRLGTRLYAINTAGGAAGALVAGFFLPPLLGFTGSYLAAMSLNVAIAAVALPLHCAARGALATAHTGAAGGGGPHPRRPERQSGIPPLAGLAFLTGFASLGVEVLWVRMFAQVLHNSVYSFALILFVFLVALALGATLAHALARSSRTPARVLPVLLVAAAFLVGSSAFVFHEVTHGLDYVGREAAWRDYIVAVLVDATLVMLPAGVAIGALFPYLLRLAEGRGGSSGAIIGRLGAANTLGGVIGSLTAGFVLLPWLGLWGSLRALAASYGIAALLLKSPRSAASRVAPALVLLALVTVFDPARLPLVRYDARTASIHELWEGRDAVVAVVRDGNQLRINVDNYYSLGGTAARSYEETQADIPLLLHPHPRSVFFLGLGSGITAGAALRHPVEAVTVCELLPAVVEASRKYFAPFLNHLFEDSRARVVVDDGRSFLQGTSERYDVIVADLLIPWQAGSGSLYAREFYESVRARLAPGGLFAQWLPLYQLSREETFVIARTMLEVFSQVTVWRGDFLPHSPIVALIGETAARPLDADAMVRNFRSRKKADVQRDDVLALMGLFYAGNLAAPGAIPPGTPIETDDRPIIEYSSPITQRQNRGTGSAWFTSLALADWYEKLATGVVPERDPYLAELTPTELDYVRAGRELYLANVYRAEQREEDAETHFAAFRDRVPAHIGTAFETSATGDH